MLVSLITAIGESDCESIGSGALAQPVNAISSLAFVVFGVVVLISASAQQRIERTNRIIFGILMVSTGIGSVLFHGPQGPASHLLHDATIIVTMSAIVAMNLAGLRQWSQGRVWLVVASIGVVVSVVLLVLPSSTNIMAGIALVALVLQDVLLHRSGEIHTRWWIAAIVAIAVAMLFFVAGRTGSPFCYSDSLVQGHGLWHILSATALWAYFIATTPTRTGIRP